MIVILDQLNAAIVAGVVLLAAFGMQLRVSQAGLEQSVVYRVKHQTLDLSEWLEDDLSGLGTDLDKGDARFAMPVTADSNTVRFEFYRNKLDLTAVPPDTVRTEVLYELEKTRVANLGGEGIQLYRLQRSVRTLSHTGWTSWTRDGASPELAHFSLKLLSPTGLPAVSDKDAFFARIQLVVVPTINAENQYIRRFNWGTTVGLRTAR